MARRNKVLSVLIVSSDVKSKQVLGKLFPSSSFAPVVYTSTVGEAKRITSTRRFDILVIDAPLKDEFGIQYAVYAAEKYNAGVMMLVKAQMLEAVLQKTDETGVMVLSKPLERHLAAQAVGLLRTYRIKLTAMEEKASSLRQKVDEIRIVNRAKLTLMEHLNMSEAEAHRHIEKTAMDSGTKKPEVAESIIKTYENRV